MKADSKFSLKGLCMVFPSRACPKSLPCLSQLGELYSTGCADGIPNRPSVALSPQRPFRLVRRAGSTRDIPASPEARSRERAYVHTHRALADAPASHARGPLRGRFETPERIVNAGTRLRRVVRKSDHAPRSGAYRQENHTRQESVDREIDH